MSTKLVRQADGAGVEAHAQEVGHGADLVGGRRALLGVGAHHVHAQHRVADERRDVERDVLGERVEPAAEALAPRQSTPASNAASGISSIRRNMRLNASRWSARSGASDSEQLPGTTVVTPCSSAGKAYGSKQSCAS